MRSSSSRAATVSPLCVSMARTAPSQRAFSTTGPVISMRGPTSVPALTLSRHERTRSNSPPMSRTPVTPFATSSARADRPAMPRCTCMSQSPGIMYAPRASIARVPAGGLAVIARMRSPSITTVRSACTVPLWTSTTLTCAIDTCDAARDENTTRSVTPSLAAERIRVTPGEARLISSRTRRPSRRSMSPSLAHCCGVPSGCLLRS